LRKKSVQAAIKMYLYADFFQFLLKITEKDETESSICGEGKNESMRHKKRRKQKLWYSKWMKR